MEYQNQGATLTREVMVEDRVIIEDGTDTRTKVILITGCREASREDR